MEDQTIVIVNTGGTLDKKYDEISGNLAFGETHLPVLLSQGRCRVPVRIESLMMMDSLDMGQTHRDEIVEFCNGVQEDKLIITHGTDTMVETAKRIGQAITAKTIILTGAMRPFSLGKSDSSFNLGCALAFVQILPPGVYIVMNGRFNQWYSVTKNREKGIFEEKK